MPAKNREAAIVVRMSAENRERLHDEAKQAGITVQALAERRLLGIANAQPLPLGRTPKQRGVQYQAAHEELPMTG